MSTFTYYWKTPDNVRHEDVIEAADRGAAFAALRERGIRPIKVEQQGGEAKASGGVRKRVVAAIAVAVALLAGGVAFLLGRSAPDAPQTVMTPQGPITFTTAAPLARQRIPGDRARIENMPTNLFSRAIEFHLAHYAEPGRPLPAMSEVGVRALAREVSPDDLLSPIRLASNDFTEHIDLKRIVVGMKKEMRAYLAGGGTAEQYLAELVKRQRQELAYRHRAETRLSEMLAPRPSGGKSADQSAAYAYWLKANAQLNSMGIYPLPLPDALRAYQMSVDIEE